MFTHKTLPLLGFLALAGCAASPTIPEVVQVGHGARPLDTLPGDATLATARTDLVATLRQVVGDSAVDRALASPTYLLAKRFAGMAPPPPPGAGPDWRPPAPSVLLIREGSGWLVATPTGWRPANADAASEIDELLADPKFWAEPAFTPACPDYGAALLLLKLPGKAESARNSQCTSIADRVVSAALKS